MAVWLLTKNILSNLSKTQSWLCLGLLGSSSCEFIISHKKRVPGGSLLRVDSEIPPGPFSWEFRFQTTNIFVHPEYPEDSPQHWQICAYFPKNMMMIWWCINNSLESGTWVQVSYPYPLLVHVVLFSLAHIYGLGLGHFSALVSVWPAAKTVLSRFAQGALPEEYLSHNSDEHCLDDTRLIWCLSYPSGGALLIPGRYVSW